MRVHVPDRPGVLSGITQALGAEGINIEDFELHHVSADRGGTVVVTVAGERAGRPGGRAARRPGLRRHRDGGGRCLTPALRIAPAARLVGGLVVPGDKSVSHRAVMLGSLCRSSVEGDGFGASADTLATVEAFRTMGVTIERVGEDASPSRASACAACGRPSAPIDVGNAGTLMRLLPGLLAGQSGRFTLDGDESIRRRPMGRVAEPLRHDGGRDRDRRRAVRR